MELDRMIRVLGTSHTARAAKVAMTLQETIRTRAIVGSGEFCYEAQADWAKLPEGWSFVEVAGVATDSQDRVYVFNRGEHPVIVFDRDGNFLRSWGEGLFVHAHGITIGPDDSFYFTDDHGHTVRKYSAEGELLLTLGTPGHPSETGIKGLDYRSIRQAAGPFNLPTNVALSATGEMYITDGYGNCRVHRFAADGTLLQSWGEPGSGPGQFNLPHGIAIDRAGQVYIADRENNRIEIFSADGEYLTEWTGIARPCDIFFDANDRAFIAEVGHRAGLFPWTEVPPGPVRGGNISVFDLSGKLQARWGGGENPCDAGDFFAPHGLCIDRHGAIYLGEVVMSAGGYAGKIPATCHSLQKFVPMKGHRNE